MAPLLKDNSTLTLNPLKQPEILLCSLLIAAAFGFGLFFEGYRDLNYAPASLALLAFGCIAIIPSFWRGLAVPSAPAALFAFGLWLYVTLSLSWSSVPFASLVTYLIFIALPLGFFGLLLSAKREDMVKGAGFVLWAGIAIVAGWAVIQLVFFRDIYGPRAHHPLPNPNNLAGLINLGLLPSLALLTVTRAKGAALIAAFALYALFFAGLVATESRGGMLGFAIAAAALLFVLRGAAPSFWKRLALIAGGSAVIFVLMGLAGDQGFAGRLGALASVQGDSAALARVAIWQNTWGMVREHMWLGTGFGTFYLYYPAFMQPGMADNSLGHWAHMDPLQYWAEMGIAAPLLFYGLCLAVAVRTARAFKALPQGAPERAVLGGLACGLLALVLHTHLTFHLYIMPIMIVSGVWLAAWYLVTAKALGDTALRPVEMEKEWQKPFMAITTFIIAGLIGVMAACSAAGQYHLLRAQDLIRQGLTDQFMGAIEQAETYAPRSFIDPEVQLAALYIDLLGKNAAALFTPEEQQALYLETTILLDNAQSQNPAWAEIDYKRGQLYGAIDTGFEPEARQMAIAALEEAVRKDKRHFKARYELAGFYMSTGRIEPAYEVLEQGLTYPHPASVEENYRPLMQRLEGLLALKRDYQQREQSPQDE